MNVKLPQEVLTDITMHISLPVEVKTKERGELLQLEPFPTVILEDSAKLASLTQIRMQIEYFLSPLDQFLECLVFFHLHQGGLFFQYVRFYLKKFEEQALSPRTSEFYSFSPSNQNVHILAKVPASVAHAVEEAVTLIDKLVNGSATYSDITRDESMDFSKRDVELDFGPLRQFAEISKKVTGNQNCLDGVKDLLNLHAIAKKILIISKVCETYELRGCTSDDDFVSILDIARNMQDRQYRRTITLQDASSKLRLIKEKLCVSSGHKEFLDLFPVVLHSIPFHCFAMEKGFGEGVKFFRQQYTLVSAQLQHEDYDHTVLSNLAGAFKFIEPFFNKEQSFGELMDRVSMLTNVSNGIQQLETVNSNIELIKIWFQKAEVSFE